MCFLRASKSVLDVLRLPPVKALGTVQQNRDIIAKKPENGRMAKKAETQVEGSFYEWGTPPTEQEERSPGHGEAAQSVKEGRSTMEIIEETPGFAFKVRDIETLRETVTAARNRSRNRDLTVCTISLARPAQARRAASMRNIHAGDICRITDYGERTASAFDAYHGQPVLVFEEFHSQIPIEYAQLSGYLPPVPPRPVQ